MQACPSDGELATRVTSYATGKSVTVVASLRSAMLRPRRCASRVVADEATGKTSDNANRGVLSGRRLLNR
jgi:hypothetical protein